MELPNDSIEKIHEEVINCKSCDLCKTRTNAVPGHGDSKASIMFIGEAPGRNDQTQCATHKSQQNAFGKQLAHDAESAGS